MGGFQRRGDQFQGRGLKTRLLQANDHGAGGAIVIDALDQPPYKTGLLGRRQRVRSAENEGFHRRVLKSRRVGGESLELLDHEALDGAGGECFRGTGVPAALLGAGADVVAIAHVALLGGICRRHGAAARHAAQQTLQQGLPRMARPRLGRPAMLAQHFLNALPNPGLEDARVLAGMDLLLVADLADIGDVGQKLVQARLGEWPAAAPAAVPRRPALGPPAAPIQFLDDRSQALVLQVEGKDGPDTGRFRLVDDKLRAPWLDVVAQDGMAAGPFTLAPGRGDRGDRRHLIAAVAFARNQHASEESRARSRQHRLTSST